MIHSSVQERLTILSIPQYHGQSEFQLDRHQEQSKSLSSAQLIYVYPQLDPRATQVEEIAGLIVY